MRARSVNLSNIAFSAPKSAGEDLVISNISCKATTYRFLEQAQPDQKAGSQGKAK